MTLPAGHATHVSGDMDALRKVPSGQISQLAVPGSEALRPGSHVVHEVAPILSRVLFPATHSSHDVLVSVRENFPFSHWMQRTLPVLAAKVPAAQLVQATLSVGYGRLSVSQ